MTINLKYLNRSGEWPSGNPRLYYRRPGEKSGVPLPDVAIGSVELADAHSAAADAVRENDATHQLIRRALRYCLRRARARSASRGMAISLTIGDVLDLLHRQDGRCALTGMGFDLSDSATSRRKPFAPSLDRLSNAEGYTVQNVRLVTLIANTSRADFGDEAFYAMCRAANKIASKVPTRTSKSGKSKYET